MDWKFKVLLAIQALGLGTSILLGQYVAICPWLIALVATWHWGCYHNLFGEL